VNIAQDYEAKPYDRVIRLNCFVFTSGTIVTTIINVTPITAPLRYNVAPIDR
jgi:hypothetical protein